MIIYNVTIKVDPEVHDDWLNWMRSNHIPDVMNTGCFVNSKLLKLKDLDESNGVTYAIQYFADQREKLEEYQTEFAPKLQAEHTVRYKDKFVAFRTVMEQVETY